MQLVGLEDEKCNEICFQIPQTTNFSTGQSRMLKICRTIQD